MDNKRTIINTIITDLRGEEVWGEYFHIEDIAEDFITIEIFRKVTLRGGEAIEAGMKGERVELTVDIKATREKRADTGQESLFGFVEAIIFLPEVFITDVTIKAGDSGDPHRFFNGEAIIDEDIFKILDRASVDAKVIIMKDLVISERGDTDMNGVIESDDKDMITIFSKGTEFKIRIIKSDGKQDINRKEERKNKMETRMRKNLDGDIIERIGEWYIEQYPTRWKWTGRKWYENQDGQWEEIEEAGILRSEMVDGLIIELIGQNREYYIRARETQGLVRDEYLGYIKKIQEGVEMIKKIGTSRKIKSEIRMRYRDNEFGRKMRK